MTSSPTDRLTRAVAEMYVAGTMSGKPFEHYRALGEHEAVAMLATPTGRSLAALVEAAEQDPYRVNDLSANCWACYGREGLPHEDDCAWLAWLAATEETQDAR